jgi:photosynthetic reaction center cytochrome c subunit
VSDYFQKGIVFGAALLGVAGGALLTISAVKDMTVPPVTSVQRGFRGTGEDQIYQPAVLNAQIATAKVPKVLPPASPAGVRASKAYKNVRVLGDLSVGQFTRLMVSITQWVAPKQGCAYCHNLKNMADDTNYTKVVARRMLQMTQNVNGNWQSHVQNIGVTCYTCHGGKPVPKYIWYNNPGPEEASGVAETHQGLGHPSVIAGSASLPYDPLTPYLEQATNIRVQSTTALPEDNLSTIKQTEWTYSLMIMFSKSLGVNCSYCHNTRAFGDWSQSSPARVNAWYGIRMVRDLNNNYLDPLNQVFPEYRKGALGDSPKIYCATCHQGIYKPLFGGSLLASFPELKGPPATTKALLDPYVPAATPAAATAPATPAPAAAPPAAAAPAAPAPTPETQPPAAASPAPAPAPEPPAPK